MWTAIKGILPPASRYVTTNQGDPGCAAALGAAVRVLARVPWVRIYPSGRRRAHLRGLHRYVLQPDRLEDCMREIVSREGSKGRTNSAYLLDVGTRCPEMGENRQLEV